MSADDAIASTNLLAGVEPSWVLDLLADETRREAFPRDARIYGTGDPADDVAVVLSGVVAIHVGSAAADTTLAVLGAGSVFGSAALLGAGARREADAVALQPSEILWIPAQRILRHAARHPAAVNALIGGLVRQVLELSARVIEARQLDAPGRVRRRLVALASASADGSIPMTQAAVAGLAGTSRATVNRVLREEVDAGTLSLGRGSVEVIDGAGLRRRAGLEPAG